MAEAKLFKVGGSQAVRLPKEFRFTGDRVRIRKEGNRVILEPIPQSKEEILAWLKEIQSAFGPDFMPEGRDQPPMQERDWSKFD
jgi:antitoxin VapB